MAAWREGAEDGKTIDFQNGADRSQTRTQGKQNLKSPGKTCALSVTILRISACLLALYVVIKMLTTAGTRWPRLQTMYEGPSHGSKYLLGVGKADITGLLTLPCDLSHTY